MSKTRCMSLLVATCVATPALAAEVAKPQVVAFNASVRVEVDPSGKPISVKAPDDLPVAIRSFIEKRVASWQYSPALQGGRPVPAVTFVSVGACAIPTAAGDGFRLGLDFKGNGPRIANEFGRMPPPSYPPDAQRSGLSGEFQVELTVSADGSAKATSIQPANGGTGRSYLATFEPTLRKWAQNLRYDPEIVAGQPVATRVTIPVGFWIGNGRGAHRKTIDRTLASSECQLAGAEAGREMGPVALDSPVKVTPAPAG